MPRYYCDYCDSAVTNCTFRARRQHNYGFRHREAWMEHYQPFMHDPRYDMRVKMAMAAQPSFGAPPPGMGAPPGFVAAGAPPPPGPPPPAAAAHAGPPPTSHP